MKKLSYTDSLTSKHRNHIITAAEAVKIANHLKEAGIDKDGNGTYWTAASFENKTIYNAGTQLDAILSHCNQYIHGIICLLFDYERIG